MLLRFAFAVISPQQIEQAGQRLARYLLPTPLVYSRWLSQICGAPVYCKLENLQRTGSFKFRGAMNCLLQMPAADRARGVVTASAGNHGLGVATAARFLGAEATIFLPTSASPLKVAKLQKLGARLVQQGRDFDEAHAAAHVFAQERDLAFIHAFAQEEVIAGQGTVGLDLAEHMVTRPSVVVVPVGGGGLAGGVAVILKARWPEAKMIGVQSEASPAMAQSLALGQVVETPIAPTIADGLAGRLVSEETLLLMQRYADDMLLVTEDSLRQAMREFYLHDGWRLEASAVAAAAALLQGKVNTATGTIVLVITGGNISEEDFARQSELAVDPPGARPTHHP